MDKLIRFASNLSSDLSASSEQVRKAKDTYIKSNLTLELDKCVRSLLAGAASSVENKENAPFPLDCDAPSQLDVFCNLVEAILLHGLKEKLTTRMSKAFQQAGRDQNNFHDFHPRNAFTTNFWSIILILCHNEECKSLRSLKSVSTPVGLCRAWLRQSLNEGLLSSYLGALLADRDLLGGFYTPTAYLRDGQQTSVMTRLVAELEGCPEMSFQLELDCRQFNIWSDQTLEWLGVQPLISPSKDGDDGGLVVTALDAIHLIVSDEKMAQAKVSNRKKSLRSSTIEDSQSSSQQLSSSVPHPSSIEVSLEDSTTSSKVSSSHQNDDEDHSTTITSSIEQPRMEFTPASPPPPHSAIDIPKAGHEDDDQRDLSAAITTGNSVKSTWSSTMGEELSTTAPSRLLNESYSTILESYSSKGLAMSSTPDIGQQQFFKRKLSQETPSAEAKEKSSTSTPTSSSSDQSGDFDVVHKKELEHSSAFLELLPQIQAESGLDSQDYKCHQCSRPIGLIYGPYRLCHLDGHLYCLDCHLDDRVTLPAQIIYNWNWSRWPVARGNKLKLVNVECEPLFDIKKLSPLLYVHIAEMGEVLELRTQLFFLHAYLFTCQEVVAEKMRKMVWPRNHLFAHVHLYSLADLVQVHSGALAELLNQVIYFARNHVASCELCRLKGYYCELCPSGSTDILYPFDTKTTRRCDQCWSVFHLKCYHERYDKRTCPKCVRERRRSLKADK